MIVFETLLEGRQVARHFLARIREDDERDKDPADAVAGEVDGDG
jgi:hypothetical protein